MTDPSQSVMNVTPRSQSRACGITYAIGVSTTDQMSKPIVIQFLGDLARLSGTIFWFHAPYQDIVSVRTDILMMWYQNWFQLLLFLRGTECTQVMGNLSFHPFAFLGIGRLHLERMVSASVVFLNILFHISELNLPSCFIYPRAVLRNLTV